ncbi:hypothetical protein RQP53_23770 [Paucibacter sp. APW11]|uniref:Uncharacterized protein n=1 Tax=Roseateles aquae TaxID=3077235 RepID=A0ABU3PIB8_9BURK|nr:hypothetical protein [Paucibacter sp. APW11]MDT9002320.1 hypothetical protein [Paucibacter sp. APW11]
MNTTSLIARAVRGLSLLALVAPMAFAPGVAAAREGAGSIGHGIKCYNWFNPVTQQWQRVCYKGV